MHIRKIAIGMLAAMALVAPGAATAAGWTATKISGSVFVSENGKWARIGLNDSVDDGQFIMTMARGSIQLSRNGETIDVLPGTMITITDRRNGRYTYVKEYTGTITVEDNETRTPHFAVLTPYMAAVVKGTVFTVSTKKGESRTTVHSGLVEVHDAKSNAHATLEPGEYATSGATSPMTMGASSGTSAATAARSSAGGKSEDTDAAEDGSHSGGNGKSHAGSSGNGNSGNGNSGNGNSGSNGHGNSGNGSGNSGNGNSGNGNRQFR